MLERQEAEVFLTLAEELHFGHTAERVGITTGRVSQTIKKMERLVGAVLFERTSRQVLLTPIGRQLADDLRPLVDGMNDAVRRAIDSGRGVTGDLHVGYLSATAGQLLLKAVALFAARHPDCEVHIREAQGHDALARLRGGDIDVLITDLLIASPSDLIAGPVLLSEKKMLAVAAGHALAQHASVSMEALADHPVTLVAEELPEAFQRDRNPTHTPVGKPIPRGPRAASFNEHLTLVAAGRGVFPVGENTPRFYPRPDIAYIPITDAPPLRWGPLWLNTNTTQRVRAFVQAAHDACQTTP
ncbi:LysR family transcriptional regulator [Streptosporangium roseum]|uniref:LysR family transcriptional regulator n=1 Tax=Streptosporangium roseum (strain ATCC 12428 / DSM 43021 / JCM 3005 / KCTC 9067 / NCIMB 10171 / NRRL 2505 / NI 9100) TaxID=479432 RepID=D2AS94_STRRD|nr:LysR family transcriptional regulator [Streptosporangium roseum]ACZ86621.1 LysR family transcriptional regulator [Streptosporangium roseum DSM 43021]